MLAEYGVLQISAGIDRERGVIVQPVRITTRGWFEGENDKKLLDAVTDTVRDSIQNALSEGDRDEGSINKVAQRAAGRILGQKYRRQPVLLPAIVVL